MSVRINDKCTGCGACAKVCPGSLITVNGGKAVIDVPEDCWGCASCLKACKFRAIEFFLGEDIGGGDTYMQVSVRDRFMDWEFYNSKGKIKTITVDRKASNKY